MESLLRTLFSSAITFIAIIPSAIIIIFNYHQSEWKSSSGSSWKSLRWERRLIGVFLVSMLFVAGSSFISISILTEYIQLTIIPPILLLLVGIAIVTFGVTLFMIRYYLTEKPT